MLVVQEPFLSAPRIHGVAGVIGARASYILQASSGGGGSGVTGDSSQVSGSQGRSQSWSGGSSQGRGTTPSKHRVTNNPAVAVALAAEKFLANAIAAGFRDPDYVSALAKARPLSCRCRCERVLHFSFASMCCIGS